MSERREQPPANTPNPGAPLAPEGEVLLDVLRDAGTPKLENLAGSDPGLLRELQRALPFVDGHFARLVERTPSAVFELAPDGTMLYANRGLATLSDRPVEELAGRNWVERLFSAEESPRAREFLLRCQTEDLRNFEVAIAPRGGGRVTLSLFTANTYGRDGTLTRILACGIDVTARKEAEEGLRRYAHDLDTAQRMAHVGSWTGYLDSEEIALSDEGFRILGYEPGAVKATCRLLIDAIHPRDRDAVLAARVGALTAGRSATLDYRIVRPSGEVRVLRGWFELECDAQGNPTRELATALDITEQKRWEERLQYNQRVLSQAQHIAQVGDWVLDLATGELNLSEEAYRIAGLQPGEVEPRLESFLALIQPQDRERVRRTIAEAVPARPPVSVECRIRRPSGEERIVQLRGTMRLDHDRRQALGTVQDVTEQRRADRALRESEERYRLVVEQAPDGIALCDPQGHCLAVNSAACRMLGYAEEEFPEDICEFAGAEDGERLNGMRRHLLAHPAAVYRDELTLRRKDGGSVPVEITAKLLPDGRLQAFLRDIGERKQAQEKLRQAATVFENTMEGILIADGRGRIVSVNRAFAHSTGYAAAEVAGADFWELESGVHEPDFYREMRETLQREGHWQGEIWKRRKDGSLFPAWESVSLIRDRHGTVTSIISVFADTSATKQAQERINRLVHYDPLTAIPNRLLFAARLDNAVERAKRRQGRIAVLYLDLDRFKFINDTLGHTYGDRLLQIVAERLKGCVRAGDTVARLGGDEFGVILDEITHPEDAALLASKIIARIAEPAQVDGQELQTSTSVGISIYPNDGQDREALAKAADAALFQAKERGRNTYWFYTFELTQRAAQFLTLERRLRRALERREFILHYQPEVEVATRKVVGVEALLRWQHPEKGLQMPESFLELAEETHLIDRIGDWVIEEACAQARRWIAAGFGPLRLAVNLSGSQLLCGRLLTTIRGVLEQFRLVPSELKLELEVTENILQSAMGTIERLRELKALGLNLAIDDFGTGYSALSSLKFLPVDRLKIDKSFLRDVEVNPADQAIAKAIVNIGHSLGLTVIAEGVETEGQLRFLQECGCDEAQGNLISPPVPAAEIGRLLRCDRR